MHKAFRPFICNRGDCAITGFSTAEALESVSPHVYPKDVVVLTVAFLCGPLPVEAVESTLETLIDTIDFTGVKAITIATPTTVRHNIFIFPTSGPLGSSISADHFRLILSAAPPYVWHKGNVLWEPSDDDKYFEQLWQTATMFWYWYKRLMPCDADCGKPRCDPKSAVDDMYERWRPVLQPLTLTSVLDHIRKWGECKWGQRSTRPTGPSDDTSLVGDAHVEGLRGVTDFFVDNCVDPTHVMVTSDPYAVCEDLEHIFAFAGHLKRQPQQVVFAAFHFNCWLE